MLGDSLKRVHCHLFYKFRDAERAEVIRQGLILSVTTRSRVRHLVTQVRNLVGESARLQVVYGFLARARAGIQILVPSGVENRLYPLVEVLRCAHPMTCSCEHRVYLTGAQWVASSSPCNFHYQMHWQTVRKFQNNRGRGRGLGRGVQAGGRTTSQTSLALP